MKERSPYRFRDGFRDGIPIGLGYLSVSFGFGITAVGQGLQILQAVLISMTNLTSAGQVAGVTVMVAGGTILEMILTQLVINLRYSLMGITLTQRLDRRCTTPHRMLMSFGVTDEVFAVAASKPYPIGSSYFYGLMTAPYVGWVTGTLLGAIAGQIFPLSLREALGVLVYSMFIAIILPPMKQDRGVLGAVLLAAGLSIVVAYIPWFSFLSDGFSIIVCAVIAAAVMALLRPVPDENAGRSGEEGSE